MKNSRTVSACLALALASGATTAAAWQRSGPAEVEFTAVGPAGLKIVGKTADLEVRDEGNRLVVSVPLANLDTGIGLRNKHMRENYLEVAKFPRAELVVAKSELKAPGPGDKTAGQANGELTIHGQTKPVRFAYRAEHAGSSTRVDGTARIDMRDFGIKAPSYAGVTVKPDVDLHVTFGTTE